MPAAEKEIPDLGIVLRFLREGQRWRQVDLARAAGISGKMLNDYERGTRTLKRETLERLISWMGLPTERIDATLACLEGNRAAGRAPRGPADRRSEGQPKIKAIAVWAVYVAFVFARSPFTLLTVEGEALRAQQEAEFLWSRLPPR